MRSDPALFGASFGAADPHHIMRGVCEIDGFPHALGSRADPDARLLFDLRCVPGRMPALLSRFENETSRIWEKHSIRQAGLWTTLIGKSSQDHLFARLRQHGRAGEALVENISSQLLARATFSTVKWDLT